MKRSRIGIASSTKIFLRTGFDRKVAVPYFSTMMPT
ncbi:magnesium transporter MRS2-11, chloroplastic [Iris pallida]|uniref:Magnesium transporter MRS2-11, chloroplastic n=1 Tax=Iris pallida TaxID=29817 RepID=A0AAX6GCF8_IRIPA|nr:magnesium transporter MRS2-11, chloroplastic [Iris pallida]